MEDFPPFPSSARRYVLDVLGFSLGDQLYRRIARRTYERERGHPLVVLIWETSCPSCGRVFRLATRRTSNSSDHERRDRLPPAAINVGSLMSEIDPITLVPISLEIAIRRDDVHLTDHGH